MANVERPEGCTDEVLTFLDELRESGVTNMYGAGVFLVDEFECSKHESHKWLSYWMQTFGERHPKGEV